jgi:dolichyl-phosphate beta-glucosyltransferase
MHDTQAFDLSLTVPVFDQGGTLARTLCELSRFLDAAPLKTQLVLVNDCSPCPDTRALLREIGTRPNVLVLENNHNRGKGYSVTRGMLSGSGRYRVFTDADLAYPLDEVWKIVVALERGADVAIACRVLPDSQYEMTSSYLRYLYTRHFMSRAFNKLVRFTLLPGVLDTQAGLKGYTAAATRNVFSRVQINGFGFDLECLFVARKHGLRIAQVPVRFRYDAEPSTVRFVRDAGTMAADLARIRWRGWTGGYEQLSPGSTWEIVNS